MNGTHADSSALGAAGAEPQPKRPDKSWSRKRWLALVTLVFAAQVALIFFLGEKHFPPPRPVANVPQLALADNLSESIALDDPTLFALPRANGFTPAVRNQMFISTQPSFRWKEPPGELLSPAVENLGAVFTRFMQANQFATANLDFKPEPKLSEPFLPVPPVFAENSSAHVEGELAQRKWLNPASLPLWPHADVIAPSRVQVWVDAAGSVVSAGLLPPDDPEEAASHYDAADQRALELARAARFSPSARSTMGQLIFNWRTVVLAATNSPAAAP
jgi:hypothetical protein